VSDALGDRGAQAGGGLALHELRIACRQQVDPKVHPMPAPAELRVAIGSPDGRRSTVWKFAAHRSEIYILSRMFGSDCKVSLHSSGQCQWSGTGAWVKKDPSRRNADRHFMKWSAARPHGASAALVLRIRIPESELREVEVEEDVTDVLWLPAPGAGQTSSFACYVTPPSTDDPTASAQLPGTRLLSRQLEDRHRFVAIHHDEPLNGADLQPLRNAMNARARADGIVADPKHRGCAVTITDEGARCFVEMCTVGA